MGSRVRRFLIPVGAAALLLGAGDRPVPQAGVALAQPGLGAGQIALVYGVGGVLTTDGTLWTYRPDQDRWLTVDEAFQAEGKTTHVFPLPVPVSSIARMESFGFLVTTAGSCWLYDLEKDGWREIGSPPVQR